MGLKKVRVLFIFLSLSSALALLPQIVKASPDTFGNTSSGTITQWQDDNVITIGVYPLSEAGSVSKITARIRNVRGDQNAKCAIYSWNGTDMTVLLGETQETAIHTAEAWYDFIFTVEVELEAGDYGLAFWAGQEYNIKVNYPGNGKETPPEAYQYNDFPSLIPSENLLPQFYAFCLYATYTPIEEEFDCQQIGMNNTIAGQPTKFSADFTDLNQSKGLSYFLFSIKNGEGNWENRTWSNSWENVVWAWAIETLNPTVGITIYFRFYVNDTSGTEYASTICFFKTVIMQDRLMTGLMYGTTGGFIIGITLLALGIGAKTRNEH